MPGAPGLFLLSGVYDLRPIRLAQAVNTDNCLHLDTEDDAIAVSPALLVRPPASLRRPWARITLIYAGAALTRRAWLRRSSSRTRLHRPGGTGFRCDGARIAPQAGCAHER